MRCIEQMRLGKQESMIDHLTVIEGTTVQVHLSSISLKATKAFTHGSIVFDIKTKTVTFGKVDPHLESR